MLWLRTVKLARGTTPIEIGSLELGEVIGAGGMGVVYEGEAGDRHVAVKLLATPWLHDERAVRRFRDEATAGAIVHHPNLTSTLAHGDTDDGIPFLIMERVCGETLGSRIHSDGLPSPRRSVVLVQQILAGLAALHEAGIVHGDVKSDNVLVERLEDGADRARLIDYGLAHVQFTDDEDVRRPGADDEMVSGTPEYMAPEVAAGHGSSMASDLYAVGIILYELITGRTPFAGGSSTEIVRRHLEDDVVPPSLRCDDELSAPLDRIVLRALSKAPADRFQSAAAFSTALAETLPLLGDRPVSRPTLERSRERPTLDWHPVVARRIARATPRHPRRR